MARPISAVDLREAAQRHTDEALAILVEIANDPNAPPAARVAASTAILDRSHGKPRQMIEGGGTGGAITVEIVTGVPR
jgi:hypothetical protein